MTFPNESGNVRAVKAKARHRAWRERYGRPRRDKDGKVIGRWTYRALAQAYNVDPTTVWAALNPDKVKARQQARAERIPRELRPLSVRIALTKREYAALKEAAVLGETSMMALTRDIVFRERPALLLEPELEGEV